MNRRMFVGGVAGGMLSGSWAALAQQLRRVARIGYLRRTSSQPADLAALRQGLQELGYIEARNLLIEERYADGDTAKLPRLARELLDLKVDVLVVDGTLTVKTIREMVGTTPIVFTFVGDPVKEGFVASLDRPGGSVTGLTNLAPQLAPKRLQLLREIVPAGRVGLLNNPANVSSAALQQFADAARSLGVDLTLASARSPAEIPNAFSEANRGKVTAILVWVDAMFLTQRHRMVDLAIESRLPAIYPEREFCDAGGLMCYGPSISGNFRRAAAYVDRILKGAKPGELPVEQPTKFEFVINLKAARALGLTIPQSLLLRADELIE